MVGVVRPAEQNLEESANLGSYNSPSGLLALQILCCVTGGN